MKREEKESGSTKERVVAKVESSAVPLYATPSWMNCSKYTLAVDVQAAALR